MVDLSPSEFSAFFEAIHGHPPFPWQARLLEQVADSGEWPELLDLPTGTGKTAALDVAVYHLALEAVRRPRRAALRMLFVVDRRTIVDQAFRRAQKLTRALVDSTVDIVKRVASRLASLSREGVPLTAVALRGGMPRSDVWARSPERPVIAISTVDQVGSRLLFRGYGLSDAMKPVHAGLLGQDTLWLLDEVHLSEPFRQTLTAVSSRYRKWADVSLPAPFSVVEMSATPGRVEGRARFGLESDDEADRVLARRLSASKPVELVADVKERAFVDTCAKKATALLDGGHLTIGVVVNRVQVARDVASQVGKSLGAKAEVRLITGRMRPLDRDDIERELTPRIGAGRDRSVRVTPLVVVATQCIEAGADFDFDALVTECASLDALRQRFGRLNRLGEIEDARGVILIRSGRLEGDPVYGDAIAATASWLTSLDSIDFGLSRLPLPALEQLRPMLATTLDAPVLLPAHLDAWSQTAPVPEPDPDVALWLHGPDRGSPEVQVVWRADLSLAQLEAAASGDAAAIEAMTSSLEALPPSSPEAMSLPLHEVRRWLLGMSAPDTADVEGAREPEVDSRSTPTREWKLVVWRGDETRVVGPEDLRSDDTLIVPTEYGGITNGNWAPNSSVATDRAEEACALQRGRITLRLFRERLGAVTPGIPVPADDLDDRLLVRDWLEAASGAPEWAAPLIARLRDETRRSLKVLRVPRWTEGERSTGFVVLGRRGASNAEDLATTEGEAGSYTGREVPLDEHLAGVASFAGDFAQRAGLSDALVADVALAANWHDIGKADPRFQLLLHGDAFKAEVATNLLAKSGVDMRDREARAKATERSGYPRGARHEVMSVALMQECRTLEARAHDWELVLHLVGSHHGHCRPFAPVVLDPSPVMVSATHEGIEVAAPTSHHLERLDSGIAERYWRLVRRYGWWGLAWLEAIVRLADHRRSEHEQQRGTT